VIGIDATTLEANAAMRSIVRRDTGERYEEFLTRLAAESGIETPTREQLAKLDRKRPKKGSNEDWESPHDGDARITKMKDGRTHLAHKAEHAVDLDTGAVVAVTMAHADQGDATTIHQTLAEAGEQISRVAEQVNNGQDGERVKADGPTGLVADKGYHSNDVLVALQQVGVRSYISEPDRGRRRWKGKEKAQGAVYANRRRIHGQAGRALLRRRGERVERSFAHAYETGGMRRAHLRGTENILKRVLIHIGGFNLGLVMRQMIGKGTPRGYQGYRRGLDTLALLLKIIILTLEQVATETWGGGETSQRYSRCVPPCRHRPTVR
jgi:transposase